MERIIAVDFDGTLCENRYPEIGAVRETVLKRLMAAKAAGAKLILWTCRSGEAQERAVQWCGLHGLHFDAVNENLSSVLERFGHDSRKIYATEYWDDRAVDPNIQEDEHMNIEIRADGAHISGYVNVTEKRSRPVVTPHGKAVEIIEPGAFRAAIERAGDISVTVDHDNTHVYASTKSKSLKLYEDDIGLHADVLITDPSVIALAREGKIRGWSFGMYNVVDELEDRAEALPIRHVKALDLDHITLVVNKVPCYSATSVEVRAEGETEMEFRGSFAAPQIEIKTTAFDNASYRARVEAVKKQGGTA